MPSDCVQGNPQQNPVERPATGSEDAAAQPVSASDSADTASLQTKLALALRTGQIGLWEWNARTQALNWDARMYQIYGIAAETPISSELWKAAIHPEDLVAASGIFAPTVQKEIRERHCFRIVHPRNGIRWIEAVQEMVLDENGNLLACIGCDQDVTARMQGAETLDDETHTSQTGERRKAAETRGLHAALDEEIARLRRYGGQMSLLMAELDHFDQIVQHFGEQVGELFLRTAAEAIELCSRSTDRFATAGRNLFAVVLPGILAADTGALSHRIGTRLAQGTVYPLNQPLSISFGVAQWQDGDDAASLRRRALKALRRTGNELDSLPASSTAAPRPAAPARKLSTMAEDWLDGIQLLLAGGAGKGGGHALALEAGLSRNPASPPPYN